MNTPRIACILTCAVSLVASAADLSRYRNFRFGSGLAEVSKLTGVDPTLVKTRHSRPAKIQELIWRPQPWNASSTAESVREVSFGFLNGELYRMVVKYDRLKTEGLTVNDIVGSLSEAFQSQAVRIPIPTVAPGVADDDSVVARWQDATYSFELLRGSYGPSFTLTGVVTRKAASALTAALESDRLDELEAPKREAARRLTDDEADKAKLEKARLANKPAFKP